MSTAPNGRIRGLRLELYLAVLPVASAAATPRLYRSRPCAAEGRSGRAPCRRGSRRRAARRRRAPPRGSSCVAAPLRVGVRQLRQREEPVAIAGRLDPSWRDERLDRVLLVLVYRSSRCSTCTESELGSSEFKMFEVTSRCTRAGSERTTRTGTPLHATSAAASATPTTFRSARPNRPPRAPAVPRPARSTARDLASPPRRARPFQLLQVPAGRRPAAAEAARISPAAMAPP